MHVFLLPVFAFLLVTVQAAPSLLNLKRPWTNAYRDSTTTSSCTDGFIRCPSNTPSAGVCVPRINWCDDVLYRNPFAPDELRVPDLLNRLTPQQRINLLQTTPVENNAVPELGIDQYSAGECLHGYCSRNPSTLYPHSTTLAASFNTKLLHRVAYSIGLEGRAWRNAWEQAGNASITPPSLTCFSPQINIVRDPRWGRGQETYGECPFLTASMASAYVHGIQGTTAEGLPAGGEGYLLLAATAKHFIAYQGASTRGQFSPTEVYISWRDQIDTFEVAWQAVVKAGTASVMCGYNSLCHDDTNVTCAAPPPLGYGKSHGIPMCANDEMLNGWLRNNPQGKWDGVVSSDCGAVQFIETDHLWVDSQPAAAAAAINAGCDFDCSISVGNAFATLLNATASGLVNQSSIDRALGRLLAMQFRMGQYDPPEMVPYRSVTMDVVNSPVHRSLAAQAAREGIVLLRNDKQILPLDAPALQSRSLSGGTLLITGPNAQLFATGNYNTATDHNVTALEGIQVYVPAPHSVFSQGCASVTSNDTSGFEEALSLAKNADVVIAVMGIDGSVEYEDSTRSSLDLPGVQDQFLLELAATGKPVVVVLMGGSAVVLSPKAQQAVAAIVWAGYGGEEAGTALADVLFGTYNPGGRLPFTFYETVDHLPAYANMSMIGLPYGRTYRYFSGPTPTFLFGEGISYSKWTTSNVSYSIASASLRSSPLASDTFEVCDSIQVSATITNQGPFDGDEVTQVYLRLHDIPVLTPLLSLSAFARTTVSSGDSAEVTFLLPPRAFAAVDPDSKAWFLYPAAVDIFVGSVQPQSDDWNGAQAFHLSLTGVPTPLSTC